MQRRRKSLARFFFTLRYNPGMKVRKLSKSINSRSVFYLNMVLFLLLNLGGTAFPRINQTDEITTTPEISETSLPTETSLPQDTETPLSTITESSTITPTSTSSQATNTPVGDQSLGGSFASDEILVRFRRRASQEEINQCVLSLGAEIKSQIEELGVYILNVEPNKVAQSILEANVCPDLRYAEPNFLVQVADVIPNDPNWGLQYGLTNIRAPQGWEFTTGSTSIRIAIIDTGIDRTHPDLAGKIVAGYDFVNGDNNAQDDNGHGTHVAGIAAAISNNGTGVAGVSWGARLIPVKVLNSVGGGSYANVAAGIVWAADHGAHVINLSLGGASPSLTLQNAVDYAVSRGVVVVAASGNSGSNFVLYPARYANVIAVAATDSSNTRAWFSNYGPEIDLSAPGVSIYSTALGGYMFRNGTSMATPYVSGLAAILRGSSSLSSPSDIALQMETTALDLGLPGWDDFYGYGLIQMDAAIAPVWVAPTATAIPPPGNNSAPSPTSFFTLPTFTLTPTQTTLPTQSVTASASPTFFADDAPSPTASETPEVVIQDIPEPPPSRRDWFLPCCGVGLILLGFLLFWMTSRRRRDSGSFRAG